MKNIALLIFFFLNTQGFCQPLVDLINIKYQRLPNVKYTENVNRQISVSQIIGNINLPLELKNKDVVILGGTFDNHQFHFSGPGISELKNLYAINLQLGYLHNWNGDKWKTMLIALPKISSDQFALTNDACQLGGLLLFTGKKSETLKFKFGLYYNSEFFGNFFMPLAGLEWKVNKKINIYGILPGAMNFEYRLNKKFYTGLSWQSITASYRIHQGPEKYFVRNGDKFWGHNQIRAFVNYHINKNLVLFIEGGFTLHRKFQMYNVNNEVIPDPIFNTTHNGILINGGMAFRVRLD